MKDIGSWFICLLLISATINGCFSNSHSTNADNKNTRPEWYQTYHYGVLDFKPGMTKYDFYHTVDSLEKLGQAFKIDSDTILSFVVSEERIKYITRVKPFFADGSLLEMHIQIQNPYKSFAPAKIQSIGMAITVLEVLNATFDCNEEIPTECTEYIYDVDDFDVKASSDNGILSLVYSAKGTSNI